MKTSPLRWVCECLDALALSDDCERVAVRVSVNDLLAVLDLEKKYAELQALVLRHEGTIAKLRTIVGDLIVRSSSELDPGGITKLQAVIDNSIARSGLG